MSTGEEISDQTRDRFNAQRAAAVDMRAQRFAGKWLADEHTEEPTDEALAAAFERCALPAKPETYPQIRAHIQRHASPVADGEAQ